MSEKPACVGCYSGGKCGERPAWVEIDGRRQAVAEVRRQWREERRLGFAVALDDGRNLVLYYYEHDDTWEMRLGDD